MHLRENQMPFRVGAALVVLLSLACTRLTAQKGATSDSIIVLSNDGDLTRAGRRVAGLHFLRTKSLIIGECDGVLLWHLDNGETDTLVKLAEGRFVDEMMMTHDEERVIISEGCMSCKTHSYSCYSIDDRRLIWRSEPVDFWTDRNGAGVSANDSLVYLVGPRRVTLLSARNGKEVGKEKMFLKSYRGPRLGAIISDFSPSGHYVVLRTTPFGLYDKHRGQFIYVWDFRRECLEKSPYFDGGDVWSVAFSADEKKILTGNHDGSLRAWLPGQNAIESIHQLNTEPGEGIKWGLSIGELIMPQGKDAYLANYGLYGGKWALKIFDYPKLQLRSVISELQFMDFRGYGPAFSTDGDYLVICDKGYLCLYETAGWHLKWRKKIEPVLASEP